jgi:hypothetical protein
LTEVEGSTDLASTWTCKADANNNLITLQYFLNADNPAGETIELFISSIRNPGDYSTPGTLYMYIETTSGGKVDSGSFSGWADGTTLFNNSFIETFTVVAENLVAGAEPVSYQFYVTPHSRVVQGAYLVLDLPSGVEVSDSNGLARGCSDGDISGFSYSILTCTYSYANHQVTLKNGYRFAYSDGDPPSIYFTLTSLRNPRSTAPTDMFNVTIFGDEDSPLFYFNSSDGPSVVMTSAPPPNEIRYERSNEQNGVRSNYSWYI